jgi:chaperonin cofactor prefoldin
LNFNYDELNARLTQVETRLTSLQTLTNDINTRVTTVETRLYNLEQFADTINLNLLNLTQQVNGMNQSINNIQSSINNILDLYKPISWFTYNNVRFTDSSGNTAYGSFHGAWYRPIKYLDVYSNEGVDLKFLMLVIREINISPLTAGVPYNSDPLVLPIGFVNNNDYRVFWSNTVTNHYMNTRQAEYFLYNVPINTWALNVLLHQGSSINSDSTWFMIGYI